MLHLQHFFKQHLLLSCIIASSVIHGVIIFYTYDKAPEQSSLGSQYTLLLESSDQPIPTVSHEPPIQKRASTQSKKTKQTKTTAATKISVSTKKSKTPISETTPLTAHSPTTNQAISQATENTVKQNKSNAGSDINMSGKALTSLQLYQNSVLKHLLQKLGNAPYFGSANVRLTMMRAGIAIKIEVKLSSGSTEYQKWLNHRILSANPFPAFPIKLQRSQLEINIPVSHLNN